MKWPWERNKRLESMLPPIKLDWAGDSGYLKWLIDKKVADFKELVLKPKVENNDRTIPISDGVVSDYVVQSAAEIVELLSPKYLDSLGRYAPREKVPELIVEMLYSQILEIGIQANLKKIRRMRLGLPDEKEPE